MMRRKNSHSDAVFSFRTGASVRKLGRGAVVIGVCVIGAWYLPSLFYTEKTQSDHAETGLLLHRFSQPYANEVINNDKSKSRVYQDRKTENGTEANVSNFALDVAQIFSALEQLQLDEEGNVIVDSQSLLALEAAYYAIGADAAAGDVVLLIKLIETGLPEPASEQVAQIVDSYFQYKLIEKQFMGSTPAAKSMREASDYNQQLLGLRNSYLGQELASKLYADRDAFTDFTLASMALQNDPHLTAEQKTVKQLALQATLADSAMGDSLLRRPPSQEVERRVEMLRGYGADEEIIQRVRQSMTGEALSFEGAQLQEQQSNWTRRMESFEAERQHILQAGLSDADKRKQIDQLLRLYFEDG